jgi:hypothetical protein
LNSLSETKVKGNWLAESYDAAKPFDLASTQNNFLKSKFEDRHSICEQTIEENRFAMTMMEMYTQMETNRK